MSRLSISFRPLLRGCWDHALFSSAGDDAALDLYSRQYALEDDIYPFRGRGPFVSGSTSKEMKKNTATDRKNFSLCYSSLGKKVVVAAQTGKRSSHKYSELAIGFRLLGTLSGRSVRKGTYYARVGIKRIPPLSSARNYNPFKTSHGPPK